MSRTAVFGRVALGGSSESSSETGAELARGALWAEDRDVWNLVVARNRTRPRGRPAVEQLTAYDEPLAGQRYGGDSPTGDRNEPCVARR